jgi:hypothetical protein
VKTDGGLGMHLRFVALSANAAERIEHLITRVTSR